MSRSRREILEAFRGQRVVVLGDVMLDEYLAGDVLRVSPEAPVPVVRLDRRDARLGGAGNVARNLHALGASVTLLGAVGRDAEGEVVRGLVSNLGIEHHLVALEGRPTTHKLRVVGRNQNLVRLDREDTRWVDPAAAGPLLERLEAGPRPAAIILSDYAKGLLTDELLGSVMRWAHDRGALVLVDPKRADCRAYRGAAYLTPNSAEAQAATGIAPTTREAAIASARALLALTGAEGILLTRGAAGMALVTGGEAHFVNAHRRQVFDVTGAGDTVIATFALALAAGAAPVDAMALANHAAGVVVGKPGAATCSWKELAAEGGGGAAQEGTTLLSLEAAAAFAAGCRADQRRVVFTNGCFDVLHAGHVALLEEARARGDALIVGLNSDASVARLKGPTRPIQTLADRARILAALRAVDAVVAFDEDTPLRVILAVRPDVLVKGGDYRFETIVGAPEVTGWGGEVATVPIVEGRSTSALLARSNRINPSTLTAFL